MSTSNFFQTCMFRKKCMLASNDLLDDTVTCMLTWDFFHVNMRFFPNMHVGKKCNMHVRMKTCMSWAYLNTCEHICWHVNMQSGTCRVHVASSNMYVTWQCLFHFLHVYICNMHVRMKTCMSWACVNTCEHIWWHANMHVDICNMHVRNMQKTCNMQISTCENVNMHVGMSTCMLNPVTMLTWVFFRTCMFGV